MFKTNLQAKFGLVSDVRKVADPWDLGIVFDVRRIDCDEYQAWARERQKASPLTALMIRAQGKAILRAIAGGRKAVSEEELRAALVEAADKAELTVEDFEKFTHESSEGTVHLIAGWSGLTDAETGAPIPCTPEAALQLLKSPEFVPEGAPFGGQSLGRAINAFLLQEAATSSAYRAGYLEAASGN